MAKGGVFWLLKFLVTVSTWHAGNGDDCQRWRAVLLVKTREMSEPASATDDSVTTCDQWLGSIASVTGIELTGLGDGTLPRPHNVRVSTVVTRSCARCSLHPDSWRVWSSDAVGAASKPQCECDVGMWESSVLTAYKNIWPFSDVMCKMTLRVNIYDQGYRYVTLEASLERWLWASRKIAFFWNCLAFSAFRSFLV